MPHAPDEALTASSRLVDSLKYMYAFASSSLVCFKGSVTTVSCSGAIVATFVVSVACGVSTACLKTLCRTQPLAL